MGSEIHYLHLSKLTLIDLIRSQGVKTLLPITLKEL